MGHALRIAQLSCQSGCGISRAVVERATLTKGAPGTNLTYKYLPNS